MYSVCIYIAKSCWLYYYDLSVLSGDGFPKNKSLDGGWAGGMSSIQVFWNFVNFAKPLIYIYSTLVIAGLRGFAQVSMVPKSKCQVGINTCRNLFTYSHASVQRAPL